MYIKQEQPIYESEWQTTYENEEQPVYESEWQTAYENEEQPVNEEQPLDLTIKKNPPPNDNKRDQGCQTNVEAWYYEAGVEDKRVTLDKFRHYWEFSKMEIDIRKACVISDYRISDEGLQFRVDFTNYFSNWRRLEDCLNKPKILFDFLHRIKETNPRAVEYLLHTCPVLISIMFGPKPKVVLN